VKSLPLTILAARTEKPENDFRLFAFDFRLSFAFKKLRDG
jgi:hypothetical protein